MSRPSLSAFLVGKKYEARLGIYAVLDGNRHAHYVFCGQGTGGNSPDCRSAAVFLSVIFLLK